MRVQVPTHWEGHKAVLQLQGGVKDLLSFIDQELRNRVFGKVIKSLDNIYILQLKILFIRTLFHRSNYLVKKCNY